MCSSDLIHSRFFVWKNFWWSLLAGGLVWLFVVLVFLYAARFGFSGGEARAVSFSALFLGNILLIFSSLSQTSGFFSVFKTKNPSAFIITGIALVFLLASLSFSPVRKLFKFENPEWLHFIPVLVGAGVLFLFLETLKKIKKRG